MHWHKCYRLTDNNPLANPLRHVSIIVSGSLSKVRTARSSYLTCSAALVKMKAIRLSIIMSLRAREGITAWTHTLASYDREVVTKA